MGSSIALHETPLLWTMSPWTSLARSPRHHKSCRYPNPTLARSPSRQPLSPHTLRSRSATQTAVARSRLRLSRTMHETPALPRTSKCRRCSQWWCSRPHGGRSRQWWRRSRADAANVSLCDIRRGPPGSSLVRPSFNAHAPSGRRPLLSWFCLLSVLGFLLHSPLHGLQSYL